MAIAGDVFLHLVDGCPVGVDLPQVVGLHRVREAVGGIGVIEMWTGIAGTTPNCADAAGATNWIQLTDPGRVNITEFAVNDAGSITKEISESKTVTFDNRQREIQITLEGQLVLEEDMVSAGTLAETIVSRRLEDTIYVRNDYVLPTI